MTDELRFRGVPACLRPSARPETPGARWTVVTDGPRNLETAPFDYRNPFPVRDADALRRLTGNGACTTPRAWPVEGDDPAAFDYYTNDNAALGIPGGPECALVDIFGTVRLWTGGVAFGLGADAHPPSVRVRTTADPRVPVVSAAQTFDGCTYVFTWFLTRPPDAPPCRYPMTGCASYPWLKEDPAGPNLIVVARCEIRNVTDAPRPVVLHVAFSQRGELCSGAWYMDARRAPEWTSADLVPAARKRFLLAARHAGGESLLGVLDPGGFTPSEPSGLIAHWPETTLLAPERTRPPLQRALADTIPPGDTRTVTWILPYFPAAAADAPWLLDADPAALRLHGATVWHERHRPRMVVSIPEKKVQDAFVRALTHLDLCSVAVGDVEYPTPGPTCGHHIFYFRDAPDMIYAYDLAGEKERAERMLAPYDYAPLGTENGYFLWGAGMQFRLWRDTAWLPRVFPAVERHMGWLVDTWRSCRAENDGLLPPAAYGDNELCHGHYVSHHLYALAGGRHALAIAEALDRRDLIPDWREFCDRFGAAVLRHLEAVAARSGGVLTPTFEGFDAEPVKGGTPGSERTGGYGRTGGCDWHNFSPVFPTDILPPDHPVVTSSLARWRHTYVEGLCPYPSDSDYAMLHTYNTMNLSGTWLRRGDWAEALRDLYGVLLHTSATHAAAEGVQSDLRWDFQCTPHNWFSGKFVRLVRDLLVYEDPDNRLHLLAGLSPAWMKPGMTVAVTGAPTTLGTVSFRADMVEHGFDLALDATLRPDAAGLILHLPPFCENVRVETDRGAAAPERSENGDGLRAGKPGEK